MKKSYDLSGLPKDMVLFLDASAFGLNDYKSIHGCKDNNFTIGYLKEQTQRLSELTEKLREMNNWTTTWEVFLEFLAGNMFFANKFFDERCAQKSKAFKRRLNQGIKTCKLLQERGKDLIAPHCEEPILGKIKSMIPHVRKVFERTEGGTNYLGTDIKLAATALVYASHSNSALPHPDFQVHPACLFSHDTKLLDTYITCSRYMGLEKHTYIYADRLHIPESATKKSLYKNLKGFLKKAGDRGSLLVGSAS